MKIESISYSIRHELHHKSNIAAFFYNQDIAYFYIMKTIHTADLHLGQVIYQNYDRVDEHGHYFEQLERICREEDPDALLVSGDVFDIQQPSASTKKYFTDHFVKLHSVCPTMKIIITAGNHDSASRIQADSAVWELANATLVGVSPSPELLSFEDGWQKDFVVKMDSGYVVALPYMSSERTDVIQSILDWVNRDNTEEKPVVMMGHLAVTGVDPCGHNIEIGKLRTTAVSSLGEGYDYLALGHIHKPQTIGHPEDCLEDDVVYPSGVVRYSGSALHVSCDEKYPHTISIVEIAKRGGDVRIRQIRIDELRHFYELPPDGSSFTSAGQALDAVRAFAEEKGKGYVRLRIDYDTPLPSNFCNAVYDILKPYTDEVRFNPKHIWTGAPEKPEEEGSRPVFEVAELQQMTDPMSFIEKTRDQYPGLDIEEVRSAFKEVKEEMKRLEEEERIAAKEKADRKVSKKAVKEEGTVTE